MPPLPELVCVVGDQERFHAVVDGVAYPSVSASRIEVPVFSEQAVESEDEVETVDGRRRRSG